MKFKEKASSLALCAVLLGTSIAPVSAATKTEIVGANRYETAAKIADKMGNYDTAILVNADKSLADGLSASSLAGKENAPILLVKKDSIPAATMQRLRNVKRVYVIGGEAAVSQRVVDSLGDVTYIRIQGANRIETSENVAEIVGNYNKAFVVNGNKGEADAMSVASIAARDKAPIILTNGKSSNEVKRPGVKYYVVGGNEVVSNSLVNKFGAIRLSGSDRYKTNRVVVNKFYPNSSKLYFTKGNPLVDALTVSPLAKNDGVVLVSAKSDNSILNGKDTVQVGGMNFGGSAKPEENKPVKPDGQKPDGGTQKPNPEENKPVKPDGNININSDAYQSEFREEFYILVNNYRASKGLNKLTPHPLQEKMTYLKSKHMIDLNYFEHNYDDSKTQYYKDKWTNNGRYPYLMIDTIYPEVFAGTGSKYGQEIITGVIGDYGKSAKGLAREAFERWQRSTGHEQSMTSDWDNYMGVSIYSGNGNIYATGAFSRK
ncbi:cell wall-binding repeat-containing protein [Peptacetobacter hiranonis]|uniref:Putative cell wall binding repeat 2 n=1 Tax=Peptacetobacter hiranonis (strain DSM 13275 / JCM 10541 / KCTC 15199 / TO-931) TaxID=500633 RepID=B6FXD8_PEPHT|nr:cell wall-binding repeat-containing protein [Peptacetobacter hiranonis]EEA85788.1 putative cell wall binding repeat 2 [Peptacetobacter hiranonis DSM 13275]QEK20573.1 N-acetylmuramoyl-L-alanine amidase LytC [Peptacetobacter hiranonis]